MGCSVAKHLGPSLHSSFLYYASMFCLIGFYKIGRAHFSLISSKIYWPLALGLVNKADTSVIRFLLSFYDFSLNVSPKSLILIIVI